MVNGIRVMEDAVVVTLPETVYSLATVYAAAYVFLDRAYVHLDKQGQSFLVTLYPKQQQSAELIGKNFLDEAINQGHYFAQLEKTQEVTKLLVERAFFSAAPQLLQKDKTKDDIPQVS